VIWGTDWPHQPRSWTDHLLWHHAAHTIAPNASIASVLGCCYRVLGELEAQLAGQR